MSLIRHFQGNMLFEPWLICHAIMLKPSCAFARTLTVSPVEVNN